MKLVRYEMDGRVGLGVLKDEHTLVDLTRQGLAGLSMSGFLAGGEAAMGRACEALDHPAGAEVSLANARLLAPVGDPGKILCIGQNYRDHCEEQNQPLPERAILFSKYSTALNDPGGVIRLLPGVSDQVDYEAELAVVIGAQGGGRNIPEAEAMRHVAGYLCANDVTARDIQF